MDNSMPRAVLIATVALMFLFVVGSYFLSQHRSASEAVDIANQPTMGNPNAPVRVLSIEEPNCPNCKQFNIVTFPNLKKDFIETGKVQYTTLIVSFSQASYPAAQALLCAFYQDKHRPDDRLFYDFLNKIYRLENTANNHDLDKVLLETASKANPEIDIEKLRLCMERQVYYTQIMRNTEIAKRLLGETQTTPAIFINGVRTAGISESVVSPAIEEALKNAESRSKSH